MMSGAGIRFSVRALPCQPCRSVTTMSLRQKASLRSSFSQSFDPRGVVPYVHFSVRGSPSPAKVQAAPMLKRSSKNRRAVHCAYSHSVFPSSYLNGRGLRVPSSHRRRTERQCRGRASVGSWWLCTVADPRKPSLSDPRQGNVMAPSDGLSASWLDLANMPKAVRWPSVSRQLEMGAAI